MQDRNQSTPPTRGRRRLRAVPYDTDDESSSGEHNKVQIKRQRTTSSQHLTRSKARLTGKKMSDDRIDGTRTGTRENVSLNSTSDDAVELPKEASLGDELKGAGAKTLENSSSVPAAPSAGRLKIRLVESSTLGNEYSTNEKKMPPASAALLDLLLYNQESTLARFRYEQAQQISNEYTSSLSQMEESQDVGKRLQPSRQHLVHFCDLGKGKVDVFLSALKEEYFAKAIPNLSFKSLEHSLEDYKGSCNKEVQQLRNRVQALYTHVGECLTRNDKDLFEGKAEAEVTMREFVASRIQSTVSKATRSKCRKDSRRLIARESASTRKTLNEALDEVAKSVENVKLLTKRLGSSIKSFGEQLEQLLSEVDEAC